MGDARLFVYLCGGLVYGASSRPSVELRGAFSRRRNCRSPAVLRSTLISVCKASSTRPPTASVAGSKRVVYSVTRTARSITDARSGLEVAKWVRVARARSPSLGGDGVGSMVGPQVGVVGGVGEGGIEFPESGGIRQRFAVVDDQCKNTDGLQIGARVEGGGAGHGFSRPRMTVRISVSTSSRLTRSCSRSRWPARIWHSAAASRAQREVGALFSGCPGGVVGQPRAGARLGPEIVQAQCGALQYDGVLRM